MAVVRDSHTISFGALNDEITTFEKVLNVRWLDPTTEGHAMVLKDSKGQVICHMTSGGSGDESERFSSGQWCNGVKVTTLGSGTVLITIA